MNLAYAKTPKGQEEIETRNHGLHPRARRVLILVDGKRQLEDLRGLCAVQDLEATISLLEQDGYIEALAAAAPNAETAANDATQAGFRPLPEGVVTAELELARNFIINTLRTFTGPYAKLTLMERAQGAQSHEQMRSVYADWRRAISESPQGSKRIEELSEQLLAVI